MAAMSKPDGLHAGSSRFRAARRSDALRIAELFKISSEGVADYVWSLLAEDYPNLAPLEIGAQRYAREDTAFSYQNCIVADCDGDVVGSCHAYLMEASSPAEDVDPVLRPYAELQAPGSLYISSLAVEERARGLGIGTRLLGLAVGRARRQQARSLSLIVFEQNTRARQLYERFGFREVGRRTIVPHPLIHAEGDALLMVTRL